MIANIFLAIVTILVLGFIWMLWLRSHIVSKLQTLNQHKGLLQSDLDKRKDMVPYLLESFKITEEPTDLWRKVLEDRTLFQQGTNPQKESDFEQVLWSFLRETGGVKTVNFLEAKKDIEDLTNMIEKEKLSVEEAIRAYNEKRKQFPYSSISGIFGFRKVTL